MKNFLANYRINYLLIGFFIFNMALGESLPANESQTSEMQDEVVAFTPPEGWKLVDAKSLSPSVKAMVIGKGEHEFPPSINLATEPYARSLNDYLKKVKEVNQADGADWKSLGSIQTQAGEGNLSQVDLPTQWGDVRMMHVILLKNNTIYILTASALKSEFPKFYKDFFTSLQSLRFSKNVENKENKNEK